MRENGYEGMPPVQEMITSLSLYGETSSLKAPSWPSKPLKKKRKKTRLNGRAYAAAGQTIASLHTKAYQTDLLKVLDKVQVWARTTRGPNPSRSEDQRWA